MTLALPRRRLLAGMFGLIAAPAVIRVAKLMPVSVQPKQWRYIEAIADFDRIELGTFRGTAIFENMVSVEGDGPLYVYSVPRPTWRMFNGFPNG